MASLLILQVSPLLPYQLMNGFQGNKKFPATCTYDADMYEAEWVTEISPRTGETFRCKQVESTFVQVEAVSISLDALDR